MNFLVLPPEINSGLMLAGAGSGADAGGGDARLGWDWPASCGSATASFSSVTSGLAGDAWQGPASVAMTGAAGGLRERAERSRPTQAEQAARSGQGPRAAAAFEAAVAATVPRAHGGVQPRSAAWRG